MDIDEPEGLPLPPIPTGKGLLLSGKIPNWLTTAVARQFAPRASWVAVYQPQLTGAVVVGSRETAVAVGQILPFHPASP
jgi:CRISPR-associated Csx3 family protein